MKNVDVEVDNREEYQDDSKRLCAIRESINFVLSLVHGDDRLSRRWRQRS